MPDQKTQILSDNQRKGRVKLKDRPPKGRPKGRMLDPQAVRDMSALIGSDSMARDRLIENLHLIQDSYGYLSASHLTALATAMKLSLAEIWEVASFYDHFTVIDEQKDKKPNIRTIRICSSLSCMLAGADKLYTDISKNEFANIRIIKAPCLGACDKAPAIADGHHLIENTDIETLKSIFKNPPENKVITDYIGFDLYRHNGGYHLIEALQQGKIDKADLTAELSKSALRGLGGAGFPLAKKWQIVAGYDAPRFMAVNGDEGEPGTFKDRLYLSRDPHRLLEGVLLAAYLVGIDKAYIYIRNEYPEIIQILRKEIDILSQSGLADHVEIELRRGAGAYICGEESAMIESIEGKRGLPRHRPPYVAEIGLFNRPTLVNNVETLYWVRDILENGAGWYNAQGKPEHLGFRSYSVSGRVKYPQVIRAAAGTTAKELIAACGGMADGHAFKAYLPGGASGGILPASLSDIPLDFGGELAKKGCFVGSHAVIILSDTDNIWQAALNLMQFFAHESCGQCTPCRSGTQKATDMMQKDTPDTGLLTELATIMADASICGLGQAAPNPLVCAMRYFPEDIPSNANER